MAPINNFEKVQGYLKSIERGDFAYIADLFSPEAVVEQLPNRIHLNGGRADMSAMAKAFEEGRKLLSCQMSFLADGSTIVPPGSNQSSSPGGGGILDNLDEVSVLDTAGEVPEAPATYSNTASPVLT